MGGWNSTLQAAWYVRHAHWAWLCYVPIEIWCLRMTSAIWLLILSSTSFMVGCSREFYIYTPCKIEIARLKFDEIILSWGEMCGSRTAIQQAQPYTRQQRYILAKATCLVLSGGWHPIDASRRCASTAEYDLWSALQDSPGCVCE